MTKFDVEHSRTAHPGELYLHGSMVTSLEYTGVDDIFIATTVKGTESLHANACDFTTVPQKRGIIRPCFCR
jgi:hypothetical protein